MNSKASTLVGLTWENLKLEPLAVQHLTPTMYIFLTLAFVLIHSTGFEILMLRLTNFSFKFLNIIYKPKLKRQLYEKFNEPIEK